MIRAAYIVKNNGEPLYRRSYRLGTDDAKAVVPPHIRACVLLLHSSATTEKAKPYMLEQDGTIWMYMFFDSFTLVLESSMEEPESILKKRILSMGKTLSRGYGNVISSWSGDMSSLDGLQATIDEYVNMDLRMPEERVLSAIGSVVDSVLENHSVAYVGVLDSSGTMIRGNIPDEHLIGIKSEMESDTVSSSASLVPKAVDVNRYLVQMLKVHSLTVVAASYREESKLDAIKAVSELADSITTVLERDDAARLL